MSTGSSQFSELLTRAAAAESDFAYERVVARAAERLGRLTRRMLGAYPHLRRWEETDDVFQEAVIRLSRSLRQLRPQSSAEFIGLATLQIRRTLIDLARHHFGPLGAGGRYRSDPLLFERDDPAGSPADAAGEPQSLAEWTAFHEAVNDLPEDDRAMFSAVFYGGMTYEAAAKVLGVTRRTAIRRMNRARIRLAKHVMGNFATVVER